MDIIATALSAVPLDPDRVSTWMVSLGSHGVLSARELPPAGSTHAIHWPAVRGAVDPRAASLVVVHVHPVSDSAVEPGELHPEDFLAIHEFLAVCEALGWRLADFLIVYGSCPDAVYSAAKRGWISIESTRARLVRFIRDAAGEQGRVEL